MIAGIGVDIVEIARLSRILEKYPDSFVRYVYTEEEQKIAASRRNSVQFFAGRWAAKEALVKALGVGIGRQCHWLDIEILNDNLGKPLIHLKGRGMETAHNLRLTKFSLSLSHEPSLACAFVLAERD